MSGVENLKKYFTYCDKNIEMTFKGFPRNNKLYNSFYETRKK